MKVRIISTRGTVYDHTDATILETVNMAGEGVLVIVRETGERTPTGGSYERRTLGCYPIRNIEKWEPLP